MSKKTIFLILFILVMVININFLGLVRVDGDSMNPNFKNDEILIINKHQKEFKRFDVIVFNKNNVNYVKRIIGLPGETIEISNNSICIDGKKIKDDFGQGNIENFNVHNIGNGTIPKNSYFVLGDNRKNSMDSRGLGFIRKNEIIGKVISN